MTLKRLRRHWDVLGKKDPLWAVLASDDKRGNRWQVDEFFATGQGEIEEVTKHVEALGVELDHGNALDFGCGVGRLTQALADRFEVVWGVDIAPSMIERANHYDRHPGTCHYRLNERPDLQMFESESFGFIYSNIVLQHIEPRHQRSYLKEFVRVLAPGGVLVFQLPSERIERESGTWGRLRRGIRSAAPAPILNAYRRIRWGRRALIEMWGMPRDEVTGLLRGEGATILDVRADRFAGAHWAGFRYTVTK
ncbi:MAG TPA: methyltransferase domain-containing protein [Actinomycetota bacterium]|nr:methyltransferase domain-containing protein [Actinomycetota bacterium]